MDSSGNLESFARCFTAPSRRTSASSSNERTFTTHANYVDRLKILIYPAMPLPKGLVASICVAPNVKVVKLPHAIRTRLARRAGILQWKSGTLRCLSYRDIEDSQAILTGRCRVSVFCSPCDFTCRCDSNCRVSMGWCHQIGRVLSDQCLCQFESWFFHFSSLRFNCSAKAFKSLERPGFLRTS